MTSLSVTFFDSYVFDDEERDVLVKVPSIVSSLRETVFDVSVKNIVDIKFDNIVGEKNEEFRRVNRILESGVDKIKETNKGLVSQINAGRDLKFIDRDGMGSAMIEMLLSLCREANNEILRIIQVIKESKVNRYSIAESLKLLDELKANVSGLFDELAKTKDYIAINDGLASGICPEREIDQELAKVL